MYTKAMLARRNALLAQVAEIEAFGKELDEVKLGNYVGPSEEPEFGKIFVGHMPDDMKRLWVLMNNSRVRLERYHGRLQSGKRVNGNGKSIEQICADAEARCVKFGNMLVESVLETFPQIKNAPVNVEFLFLKEWTIWMVPIGVHLPVIPGDFGDLLGELGLDFPDLDIGGRGGGLLGGLFQDMLRGRAGRARRSATAARG
ncbi:MAG: hypothetical protein WC757_03725 [Candidatus Paceibacterota bacterium]